MIDINGKSLHYCDFKNIDMDNLYSVYNMDKPYDYHKHKYSISLTDIDPKCQIVRLHTESVSPLDIGNSNIIMYANIDENDGNILNLYPSRIMLVLMEFSVSNVRQHYDVLGSFHEIEKTSPAVFTYNSNNELTISSSMFDATIDTIDTFDVLCEGHLEFIRYMRENEIFKIQHEDQL